MVLLAFCTVDEVVKALKKGVSSESYKEERLFEIGAHQFRDFAVEDSKPTRFTIGLML